MHKLPKFHKKHPQRVGRGGKRGSYSGRGIKGQKSRSGRKMRPAERDLIIRLPKLRGFKNKPRGSNLEIYNLKDLAKILKSNSGAGKVLDMNFLKESGLLPKHFYGKVKILGNGDIDVAISVSGLKISKSAKNKILKAGGTIK
ncbi:MAG: 50S ribosomal protein L15 [bacterium]|nr:50S ribosomal protein L15 [bacterium]